MIFYNEIEAYPATWTENLIEAGHLPLGIVSRQDIRWISQDWLRMKDFDQCHFFNGIGGWSYALKLAGLSDKRGIWTGSCPCQPFSVAGKGKGDKDERHLWPHFKRIIDFCKPSIIFGEQVSGPAGRQWLSGVRLDLEGMGYAVGAADLPACSVGAPHIRQRLFWGAVRLGDSDSHRRKRAGVLLRKGQDKNIDSLGAGAALRMAYAEGFLPKRSIRKKKVTTRHSCPRVSEANADRCEKQRRAISTEEENPWAECSVIRFNDGKTRRIKPGIMPMADGIPGRVGYMRPHERRNQIKAYGNAIVPQIAAAFIMAFMDAIQEAIS